MANILDGTVTDLLKWRYQAERAAMHLKSAAVPDKARLKLAFAFDDAVIDIELKTELIDVLTGQELGALIYGLVLGRAQKVKH
jgi:hypothetical protein